MEREITLNSLSLKVERQNALAMIEGYRIGPRLYHVAIFTAHEDAWSLKNNFRERPKLLTCKRSGPRPTYPLSAIGRRLPLRSYYHKHKYAAVLDRIFHIENQIDIWQQLCSNGVFDIWDPEAPFNSLDGKSDPMILALRIYELDHETEVCRGQYADNPKDLRFRVMRPVIDADEFEDILGKVRSATRKWVRFRGEELVSPHW